MTKRNLTISLRFVIFRVKWHQWHNLTPPKNFGIGDLVMWSLHSEGDSLRKVFNQKSWTWWNSKILILHHSRPKLFSLIRFTKICIQCWNVHYKVILHRIAQSCPGLRTPDQRTAKIKTQFWNYPSPNSQPPFFGPKTLVIRNSMIVKNGHLLVRTPDGQTARVVPSWYHLRHGRVIWLAKMNEIRVKQRSI